MRQPQGPANPPPIGENRPPFLLEGGDLVGFSIREDTPVGTEVRKKTYLTEAVLPWNHSYFDKESNLY